MYKVELKVSAISEAEAASAVLVRQKNRGGTWINEEQINVTSADPLRVLLLENDQRVLVQGHSNVVQVYDRTQMMATSQTVSVPSTTTTPPDGDESPPSEVIQQRNIKAWMEEDRLAAARTAARQRLKEIAKEVAKEATKEAKNE